LNYGPKRKPSLPPGSIQSSNQMKRTTLWKQWHSLARRSSLHKAKGADPSNNSVKLQGRSSRTTTSETINSGDLPTRETIPTETTKIAVSVDDKDTVKRNVDSG